MSDKCLELVIYKIKDGFLESFLNERTHIVEALKAMDGYICIETMHSVSTGNLYIDMVYWDALSNAESARLKFCELANHDAFMANVEEVVFDDRFVSHL